MKLTRGEFLRGAAAAGAVLALAPLSPVLAQSQNLILRRIPSTGEMIPAIGLGTAQNFGEAADEATFASRKAVIQALLEGGGTVIDTSPTYTKADQVIGRALAELGMRDKAHISGKISISGEQAGVDQLNQEFKDLRTDKIETVHVHNLRDTTAHLKTLRRLKDEGKIKYIGVTTSFANAYDNMIDTLNREKLDWMQINYALDGREVEKRILPLARDKGVAVMINLPFGRNRLFSKVRDKTLPGWAAEIDCTSWAQVFLKFVLANEAVTVAIPGTNRAEHMKDNLGAMRGRLPSPELIQRMIETVEAS
jgi:aryl-alcohol dehydrogenase-like predicted oxidoreductase